MFLLILAQLLVVAPSSETCDSINNCMKIAQPACGRSQIKRCLPGDATALLKVCVYQNGTGVRLSRHRTRELARAAAPCDFLSTPMCPAGDRDCADGHKANGCYGSVRGLKPPMRAAMRACIQAAPGVVEVSRVTDQRPLDVIIEEKAPGKTIKNNKEPTP